jgi:thiosulfate dehydrogenase [quinone] large subunit
MMAGTVSTNPLMFGLLILIILAWKNAGYYGLDRYLLPLLGTPWRQEPAATNAPQAPQDSAPESPPIAYGPR